MIVMFGMLASAAVSLLASVEWTQRNMMIFGVALSVSVGLNLEPDSVCYPPETLRIILTLGRRASGRHCSSAQSRRAGRHQRGPSVM